MPIKDRIPTWRTRSWAVGLFLPSVATAFVAFPAAAAPATVADASGPGSHSLFAATHPTKQKVVPGRLKEGYGRLPLCFEANRGQAACPSVKFLARGSGYNVFLTATEAVLALSRPEAPRARSAKRETRSAVLRMKLLGANPAPRVEARDPLPGRSHYFLGNDPKKWRADIPHYARVEYHGVYPGVDLVYYGNQRRLEYDFVVAPGTDPSVIRLAFEGAKRIHIDPAGDLILRTAGGEIRQHRPVVYQEVNGARRTIPGRYQLQGKNRVGFRIGRYDATRPLVIDPVLSYATYLGGTGFDRSYGIAVDAEGNSYVTGETNSLNFPATASHLGGTRDAFVAKLNPTGTALLYATYLGGSGSDGANAIAVDATGSAVVTGHTASTNFPKVNAYQGSLRGSGDAFVAKLSATGTALLYATYLGGNSFYDTGRGVAVDAAGHAYVTGETASTPSSFPLRGALQSSLLGTHDAFVAKLDTHSAGDASLVYSTYLGGSGYDAGSAIAVDAGGSAYVTGSTASPNFPLSGAFQGTFGGGLYDAFVAKLDLTASGAASLVYSTFLGGSDTDQGLGIAADAEGNAYIAGATASPNFPAGNGYQTSVAGSSDAFIAKLDTNLPGAASLGYATYLGGSGFDRGTGIAVNSGGTLYMVGETASPNFPALDAIQTGLRGSRDAFVAALNPATTGAASLLYSTYLGGGEFDTGTGIAVDAAGSATVTGFTSSPDLATAGALQGGFGGGLHDAFVAQVAAGADLEVTQTAAPSPVLTGAAITYTITVANRGPSAALSVKVTDNLPGEVTFLSGAAPGGVLGGSGNDRTVTFASIPSGASATITLEAEVSCALDDGAAIVNTATVSAATSDPNPANNSATATATASNPPPVITAPADVTTGNDPGKPFAALDPGTATATDNCPGVRIDGARGDGKALTDPYPIGTTMIMWTATDASGNQAMARQSVTVNDVEPPVISEATVDRPQLWPPNHQMVDVTVQYKVTDNCDPLFQLTRSLDVTSSEPVHGTEPDDLAPDWEVMDAHHVRLRAERAGSGNGRSYTITITCTDKQGNVSRQSVKVTVPKSPCAKTAGVRGKRQ